jgi:hypothetical protein
MSNRIPFVISEAYPDYKRPCLNQIFGACFNHEVSSYFINKAAEFIFERSDYDAINDIKDITNFWAQFYDEYYMDNHPWEANVFIDDKWVNVTPSDEEIFERIQQLKQWESEDVERDCNRLAELSDDEEKNDETFYQLSNEDKLVINKMREYFEKDGFNFFGEKNKTEEIINTLNKLVLQEKTQEFQENKEVFSSFTNILLKYIEKDIEKITSEMEIIHTAENSKKLTQIMDVYGSLLEYKNHFKI